VASHSGFALFRCFVPFFSSSSFSFFSMSCAFVQVRLSNDIAARLEHFSFCRAFCLVVGLNGKLCEPTDEAGGAGNKPATLAHIFRKVFIGWNDQSLFVGGSGGFFQFYSTLYELGKSAAGTAPAAAAPTSARTSGAEVLSGTMHIQDFATVASFTALHQDAFKATLVTALAPSAPGVGVKQIVLSVQLASGSGVTVKFTITGISPSELSAASAVIEAIGIESASFLGTLSNAIADSATAAESVAAGAAWADDHHRLHTFSPIFRFLSIGVGGGGKCSTVVRRCLIST
jgi:hypothetical protein